MVDGTVQAFPATVARAASLKMGHSPRLPCVIPGTATPATDAAAPQYEDAEEEDAEQEAEGGVFVKYDQVLHGTRRQGAKGAKSLVTRKFLKKFIHYAHARTPRLTDEVRGDSPFAWWGE